MPLIEDDHLTIFNAQHLRQVLSACLVYYNETRTHLALSKDRPVSETTPPPDEEDIVAFPQLGGRHHRYERRAP